MKTNMYFSQDTNVIKTLAIRHQFVMAQKLKTSFGHQLSFGKVTTAPDEVKKRWLGKLHLDNVQVEQVSWITYGYKYAPSFMFYYKDEHLIEIQIILLINQKVYLEGKLYNTELDRSGYSYKLLTAKSWVYLSFENVKLLPTFNKVVSTYDNSYHVTIV